MFLARYCTACSDSSEGGDNVSLYSGGHSVAGSTAAVASHSHAFDGSHHSSAHSVVGSTGESYASNGSQRSDGSQASGDSGSSDDPAVARLENARIKVHGAQRRLWMQEPNDAGCFIAQAATYWEILSSTHNLGRQGVPARYIESEEIMDHKLSKLGPKNNFLTGSWGCDHFSWWGYTAAGIMILMAIKTFEGWTAPPISEISRAIYAQDHPINGLRQDSACMVHNMGDFALC